MKNETATYNEKPTFEEVKEMLIIDYTDELEEVKEYGENAFGEDEDYFEQLISDLEDCETPEEIMEVLVNYGRIIGDVEEVYSDLFE